MFEPFSRNLTPEEEDAVATFIKRRGRPARCTSGAASGPDRALVEGAVRAAMEQRAEGAGAARCDRSDSDCRGPHRRRTAAGVDTAVGRACIFLHRPAALTRGRHQSFITSRAAKALPSRPEPIVPEYPPSSSLPGQPSLAYISGDLGLSGEPAPRFDSNAIERRRAGAAVWRVEDQSWESRRGSAAVWCVTVPANDAAYLVGVRASARLQSGTAGRSARRARPWCISGSEAGENRPRDFRQRIKHLERQGTWPDAATFLVDRGVVPDASEDDVPTGKTIAIAEAGRAPPQRSWRWDHRQKNMRRTTRSR